MQRSATRLCAARGRTPWLDVAPGQVTSLASRIDSGGRGRSDLRLQTPPVGVLPDGRGVCAPFWASCSRPNMTKPPVIGTERPWCWVTSRSARRSALATRWSCAKRSRIPRRALLGNLLGTYSNACDRVTRLGRHVLAINPASWQDEKRRRNQPHKTAAGQGSVRQTLGSIS